MAKSELRAKALEMRKKGMSYSQIKNDLGVSKGTLSVWLHAMPLPEARLRELRDHNEIRIERCRRTKARKRESRLAEVSQKMSQSIGMLSDRELFLSGLFLYWAEGTKAARGLVQLTNTDPNMLQFFIRWLESVGAPRQKLRIKLHLYSDMDIEEKMRYWSDTLEIGIGQFSRPYIKENLTDKRSNYKGRFGMGTCSITLNNIVLYERIMAGISHICSVYAGGIRPYSAV